MWFLFYGGNLSSRIEVIVCMHFIEASAGGQRRGSEIDETEILKKHFVKFSLKLNPERSWKERKSVQRYYLSFIVAQEWTVRRAEGGTLRAGKDVII